MTKAEFRTLIKQRLGYPMVKIELADCNLDDAINMARNKYIKWATGQATYEHYFTVMLSAGQYLYDMPVGTVDILQYDDKGLESGINTLFTVENYLYMNGYYGNLNFTTGYGLIGYHIAIDFLETLHKYTPSPYNWKYHKLTNQLEINPAPPSGNSLAYSDGTVDSPGWVLCKGLYLEAACLPQITSSTSGAGAYDIDPVVESVLWEHDWIQDYATAFAKHTLGMIRRKFANFSSIGNTGISLDGDSLVSEGKEEMTELEIKLKDEEVHEGWAILMG